MLSKRIIGLGLTGVMLSSSPALAADLNSMKEVRPLPISMPILIQQKPGIMTAKEVNSESDLVKYDVKIPKVNGLKDTVYQEQLNSIIMSRAMKDIKNVETQAEEVHAKAEKEGWTFRPYQIVINYDLKSTKDIISFTVTTYSMTGGANGNTRVDCYNIDINQNSKLELKDLFNEGTDYKTAVNREIASQIEAQKKQENKVYFEGNLGFKTISDSQSYYIQDDNLVVVFQKYSIAPGYMGTPEFKISLDNFKEILKPKQQVQKKLEFSSITGTVKKLADLGGFRFAWIETKEGKSSFVTISKDTFIANNANLTEGTVITSFYNSNAPMLMIYPLRYKAEVVIVPEETQNVKVDRFDKDLMSSDNNLKLNISDKTEILLQDGTKYQGSLENRRLVVYYGPTTRSIPAQTSPSKIIVLFENELL